MIQVIERALFIQAKIDIAKAVISTLASGTQATISVVRRTDGLAIWNDQKAIAVKLFNPAFRSSCELEFETLEHLYTSLNGQKVAGWRLCVPEPIFLDSEANVIAMTLVPGVSLYAFLQEELLGLELEAIIQGVLAGLELFWSSHKEIYGDLNHKNILVDLENRILSFVDPGPPDETFFCSDVSKRYYPQSRDVAYILFELAANWLHFKFRLSSESKKIEAAAKSIIRFSLASQALRSTSEFVEEINDCVDAHLMRIDLSIGPLAPWRWIMRHSISHRIELWLEEVREIERREVLLI